MARVQIIRTGGAHDHTAVLTFHEEPPRALRAGDIRRAKIKRLEEREVEWLHRHGWCLDDEQERWEAGDF